MEDRALLLSFDGGVWRYEGEAVDQDDVALSKSEQAQAFLVETLAQGSLPSDKIIELAKQDGIAKSAIWDAKNALGKAVRAKKLGMKDGWVWELDPARLPLSSYSSESSTKMREPSEPSKTPEETTGNGSLQDAV